MHADIIRFCEFADVSQGSGFEKNVFPSISIYVCYYDPPHIFRSPIVSWTGIAEFRAEKSLSKENYESPTTYNVLVRPGAYMGWGTFFVAGNNVNFTNINSRSAGNEGTIVTWSENNGQYSRCVKRENASYNNVSTLSHNGIQTMVSNGNDFSDMKATAFNTRVQIA